jgi:hypothetical protein
VRATNPKGRVAEMSTLCSNPEMPAAMAVGLIFNRWLQENDFKTLDQHFGLMEMTSRDFETYAAVASMLADRQVESASRKAARKALAKAEAALAKLLLSKDMADKAAARAAALAASLADKLAALPSGGGDDGAWRLRTAAKLAKAKQLATRMGRRGAQLNGLAAEASAAVAEARRRHDETPATESRRDRAVREGRCRPDTRKKAVMDNFKILARNVFQLALELFRRHYDNRRDDAVILRSLTRAPGVVRATGGEVVIELWPKANLSKATKAHVRSFLADIEGRINRQCQGRASPLRLKLLDTQPKL